MEEEAEQLRLLAAYLESRGGRRDMVDGWRAETQIRRRDARFNSPCTRFRCFSDPSGKRFRSHPEIARHFELEAAPHILHDEEGEDEQICSLAAYLESCGGTRDMVDGWRARTGRRGDSTRHIDRYFFDREPKVLPLASRGCEALQARGGAALPPLLVLVSRIRYHRTRCRRTRLHIRRACG